MSILEKTRKGLWARARDTCVFPSCHQSLTEDDQDASTGEAFVTVVGEEAHIRSSKSNGPRHDPTYPKDKLDRHENLILLCSVHHTMVDANKGDGDKVADLIKMREDHECKQQRRTELGQTVRVYLADQYEIDDNAVTSIKSWWQKRDPSPWHQLNKTSSTGQLAEHPGSRTS